MRAQLSLIVAVAGAALITPGAVLAVDKASSSLEQPSSFTVTSPPPLTGPRSTKWTNGTAKGSSKFTGCKVQVQIKGTTLADTDGIPGTGDEVICLSDNDVDASGIAAPGGVILRGEVSGGSIKIKADLTAEITVCGAIGPIVEYDSRMTCYEASPTYNATAGCGNPACSPIPFASDPTQCACSTAYPTRPTTPLIATGAAFFPAP